MTYLYIRKRRQYKMTSSSRLLKYTASGGTPRSRGSATDMESGSVHSLHTHHFTYEELEEATDSFSGALEIGDGGFGTVYKGTSDSGTLLAWPICLDFPLWDVIFTMDRVDLIDVYVQGISETGAWWP